MVKTNFLRIICPRCSNRQIIFGKASIKIKCLGCNYLLTRTGGGKTRVRARVREVLWP